MNESKNHIVKILIVLLLGLGLASPIKAQQKVVENLELRGYRTISAEKIKRHIKTKPGDIYDDKQIKSEFQSVMKMGMFDASKSRISIENGPRGGVSVIFNLIEN